MTKQACVLAEGFWTFDRTLILLKSSQSSENISKMEFTDTSIWIQIHNVPFNCLTRSMAQLLWNQIGTVEDIDCDD